MFCCVVAEEDIMIIMRKNLEMQQSVNKSIKQKMNQLF